MLDSIEAVPENLQLKEPYSISSGTQHEANYVVVIVKDADGMTGIGEASPMPGYSKETQSSIIRSIRGPLTKAVVGGGARGVSAAVEAMDEAVPGVLMAKSAVEVALTDMAAKKLGLSLIECLGGAVRDEIGVAGGIGFMSPKLAAEKTSTLVERGVSTIKIKIGRSIDEDLELVGAVRKAVGSEVDLRLDANQAYTASTAVSKLRRLERFDPVLFEQPVHEDDIEGMARIARLIDTPIMADEPIETAKDVIEYAAAEAADLVKVKVNKCGGLRKANLLCETARLYGMKVVIGSGHESSIGVAAEAALALTNSNFDPVGEMNGNQRLVKEWVRTGFLPVRGKLRAWKGPGLGLDFALPDKD